MSHFRHMNAFYAYIINEKCIFLYFILFNACAPVKVHVGRLGQLVGDSSLLPLCVFGDQTQNSGFVRLGGRHL